MTFFFPLLFAADAAPLDAAQTTRVGLSVTANGAPESSTFGSGSTGGTASGGRGGADVDATL
jgi:hypothetical protein